jgi:nitrite reductase (NADH) small subunit
MALSRGMTGSMGDQCEPKVACPFHKKAFSLLTGECLTGEDYKIRTYPVKVKEGKLYIWV